MQGENTPSDHLKKNIARKMEKWRNWKPVIDHSERARKEHRFSHIARQILMSSEIELRFQVGQQEGENTMTTYPKIVKLSTDKSFYHALTVVMIHEGMKGNIKAISELLDRTEGKAPQKIDISDEGIFRGMDRGQMKDAAKELMSRLAVVIDEADDGEVVEKSDLPVPPAPAVA